jgi:purine nucleosidase/pyrimidine-specific ribonucleoside hydrolase
VTTAPRPVVIDTDPGIDDAIAILFALAEPALEVLALTTVGGNIGLDRTTDNALRLLTLAGRSEVPVFAGAAHPLVRPPVAEVRIHGQDGLGGVVLPAPLGHPRPEPAAEALAGILTAHPPGGVDLLALGPLTNLAALIAGHPGAAARIGRVIAMGGAVREAGNTAHGAEFNLGHDPEAAGAVLAAGLDLTLIPLDATRRVRAGAAWLDRLDRQGTASARTVRALVGAYLDAGRVGESRPLHDPCVPLLAVAPGLFGCEEMRLAVDLADRPGVLGPGPHPLRVAMTVDAAGALDRIADRLGPASAP